MLVKWRLGLKLFPEKATCGSCPSETLDLIWATRADLQERSRHMQAAQHSTRLHCRLLSLSPIEPNTGGRVRLSKSETTGRHFVADMESWQRCRSRCHRGESAQQFQYRRSDHPGSRDCNTNTNTNTKSQYLGPQYQYQYQYYQNFDPQYQYQYLDPSIPIPEGSIPQKWY